MTDTTENHFARDLAEQTEQDDPVMMLMRADDAREVIALLRGIYDAGVWDYFAEIWRVNVDAPEWERIERVLAAHEPREKSVSDD